MERLLCESRKIFQFISSSYICTSINSSGNLAYKRSPAKSCMIHFYPLSLAVFRLRKLRMKWNNMEKQTWILFHWLHLHTICTRVYKIISVHWQSAWSPNPPNKKFCQQLRMILTAHVFPKEKPSYPVVPRHKDRIVCEYFQWQNISNLELFFLAIPWKLHNLFGKWRRFFALNAWLSETEIIIRRLIKPQPARISDGIRCGCAFGIWFSLCKPFTLRRPPSLDI